MTVAIYLICFIGAGLINGILQWLLHGNTLTMAIGTGVSVVIAGIVASKWGAAYKAKQGKK